MSWNEFYTIFFAQNLPRKSTECHDSEAYHLCCSVANTSLLWPAPIVHVVCVVRPVQHLLLWSGRIYLAFAFYQITQVEINCYVGSRHWTKRNSINPVLISCWHNICVEMNFLTSHLTLLPSINRSFGSSPQQWPWRQRRSFREPCWIVDHPNRCGLYILIHMAASQRHSLYKRYIYSFFELWSVHQGSHLSHIRQTGTRR